MSKTQQKSYASFCAVVLANGQIRIFDAFFITRPNYKTVNDNLFAKNNKSVFTA